MRRLYALQRSIAAKALVITVSQSLLLRADEVIE
jgi:hypothetical protein